MVSHPTRHESSSSSTTVRTSNLTLKQSLQGGVDTFPALQRYFLFWNYAQFLKSSLFIHLATHHSPPTPPKKKYWEKPQCLAHIIIFLWTLPKIMDTYPPTPTKKKRLSQSHILLSQPWRVELKPKYYCQRWTEHNNKPTTLQPNLTNVAHDSSTQAVWNFKVVQKTIWLHLFRSGLLCSSDSQSVNYWGSDTDLSSDAQHKI